MSLLNLKKKPTVYRRVYDHLAQIEKETEVDFSKHGTKTDIADSIHRRMPDVQLSSVERELRHILTARRETGENPDK